MYTSVRAVVYKPLRWRRLLMILSRRRFATDRRVWECSRLGITEPSGDHPHTSMMDNAYYCRYTSMSWAYLAPAARLFCLSALSPCSCCSLASRAR